MSSFDSCARINFLAAMFSQACSVLTPLLLVHEGGR